jgi:hypothetical protein
MDLNFQLNKGPARAIDSTSAAGLQAEVTEGAFPLSPAQALMLFDSLRAPKAGVYLEQIICRADGELDLWAFKHAWQHVVARHDILRTSYRWENLERPFQIAERAVTFPFQQDDWRELSESEQEDRLECLLCDDRAAGFDFSKAPLARLILIRVAEKSYLFIWSLHLSLLDGWSQALILKQVFTAYKRLARGDEPQISFSRPYRDYVDWLLAQDLSEAEEFWTRKLEGFTAPTSLGIALLPPGSDSEGISCEDLELWLTSEETARLQNFARQNRLTMFTLVQGAWALLLSRYSGSDDVVYGITAAVRPPELAGIESTAGLLINTIPVRTRFSSGAEITSWLKDLQIEAVEAREYQHTPLVQIQSWSEVARGLALFKSILVFQNFPIENDLYDLGDEVCVRRVRWIFSRSNYPLTVVAMPWSQLGFRFVYHSRRFEHAAIQQMLEDLRTMLEQFVIGPTRKLAELHVLTQE